MKRLLRALTVLGFPAALALPVSAPAQDSGWTVTVFHADYTIHPDAYACVSERIAVDFDGLERHGIYRSIPVRGSFRVFAVTDGEGNPIPYEVSGTAEKSIKIGDPDRTVTGEHVYVIDYAVQDAVRFVRRFDQMIRQVTGTRWPVPIEHASAIVRLEPQLAGALADSLPWVAECYAGGPESGSEAACAGQVVSPGIWRFETLHPLAPGEGLTVIAQWPKGAVSYVGTPSEGPCGPA
jgi:hypothetical protein